jgi:hypothetical protein
MPSGFNGGRDMKLPSYGEPALNIFTGENVFDVVISSKYYRLYRSKISFKG